jgi:methyl-accepting chemotaxis protein
MTPEQSTTSFQRALRVVVSPATWVLSRLRFLPKFGVIGLVILAPQLLVAWLQYSAATASVEFNRSERVGVAYLTPLHDYLGAQQRHWVASVARATGSKDQASVEATAADEVARSERQVDAVDDRHGALLRTTARWKDAKAAWAKVIAASGGTPVEIDKAHADATAITTDLIVNYVANYSKLILDPDLDSYWLMDTAIVKAPALGNLIAQQTTGAAIVKADRTDYLIGVAGPLTASLSALADTEAINLKTAFESTKDFGNSTTLETSLKEPFASTKAAVLALADRIKSGLLRPALAVAADPAAAPSLTGLFEASLGALDKLDKFYDAVNPELAALIERRVAGYERTRRQGVALTLLGLLLFIYIFAGFYVGVAELVATLGLATTRMVAGTSELFVTTNRDETAGIVSDFNTINRALVESRDLQHRVQSENAQIQQNIVDLLKVVSDASDGNLTVRAVTTTGALGNVGDAFNLLMESLEELIGEVSKQVGDSDQAVRSISEVAKRMASGATSQNREVGAARQLVSDVAKQISEVSSNAEGASSATQHTATTAQEGEKAVEDVIQGMDSLRANVQSGAKKMKNLGDRSMEITSIVGTISRISEQTNMLALNAAIEAARAGEHGRGFRVVAEEVRKLAERAGAATKDIEKLVKAITAETNETIRAIEQQTQVVEDESRTVGAAGESLRKIRTASDKSAGLVANITTVARLQVEQAQRVARSMESVSAIAAETEKGAETTVVNVTNLVRLSDQLRRSIGKFRVTNGAHSS